MNPLEIFINPGQPFHMSTNHPKPDSRIWVRSDHTPASLQGLDVEYQFSGTSLPSASRDTPRRTWHGTLTSIAGNEPGEISVRLVTNHPLEDPNGREIYQIDLDQPSVSSLRQDPGTGNWTLYLPDLYRPGR